MPSSSHTGSAIGSLNLLLISDQAEEIKRTTIAMRALYAGCRIETVYTPEEGLEWASKQHWQLILVDEQLPGRSGLDILHDLRDRAQRSAIIILLQQNETSVALQAMQAGADLALIKASPTFLAELPVLTREVFDKRQLREKLDLSDRYLRLIEDLSDLVYELDPQGRFVYISPTAVSLLGYRPEELIGAHYSSLLQPLDPHAHNCRLNERRTGTRASRGMEVRLLAKSGSIRAAEVLEMEVAAAGLYDHEHKFLGSIGIARDITKRKQDQARLKQVNQLTGPLTEMLTDSEHLLSSLKQLQLDQQLRNVASHAARLAVLGRELLGTVRSPSTNRPQPMAPGTVDHVEVSPSEVSDKVTTTPQSFDRDSGTPAESSGVHTASMHHADLSFLASRASLGAEVTAPARATQSPPVLPSTSHTIPASRADHLGTTLPTQEEPVPAAPNISLRELAQRPESERRRFPRAELELEAKLRENGSTWEGRVLNMSLGGLYMLFQGVIQVACEQPVELGLGGEGGVLEIHGRVRHIRAQQLETEPGRHAATGLAVEFTDLGPIEQRILASILEGLHEGSITVKLTGTLMPQETNDPLAETAASGTATRAPVATTDSQPVSPAEQRMASRVNIAMPVSVAAPGTSLNAPHGTAHTTNLSVTGTCIRMPQASDLFGRRILLRLSPPSELTVASGQSLSEPAWTVMGEVMWSQPDGDSLPNEHGPVRMGIRFLHLKEESRRRISGLVGHLLTVPGRLERWEHETEVVSELTECQNLRGQRIALYHDHSRAQAAPGSPVVIISPGYGETKKDYVGLAYHLARNAVQVLRYDHSNHVGESEGELPQSTLSGMKDDLMAVIAYAERTHPASPIAIVAMNLSARPALKVSVQDRRIKLLLIVAGVVDVQATLREVHQEDYFATHLQGVRRGIANILGLNVDADRWVSDAIKHGYADLRTTLRDAAQVQSTIVWFVAQHDAWVRESAVKEVHNALGGKLHAVYSMPAPLHRVPQDEESALQVFQQIVYHCRQAFSPLSRDSTFRQPPDREIGLQRRLETERARAVHQMGTAESIEFWRDYLAQFHYIANFPDYWHLLEQVYGLLGGAEKKERILDAGCGNGNFGMFMLINHAYRQQLNAAPESSIQHYVAVDFVPSALAQARLNLDGVSEDLQSRFPSRGHSLMTDSLIHADLNMSLPFRSDQFQGIICNLVIGYLQDPLFTLRELLRILAPKGRLVLTNLKPDADLTQIYRDSIPFANPGTEAKDVLATTGRIQEGQREGVFQSFDRQTLARLLMSSGAIHPRIYSAFANQAFVAVAEKPSL